MNDDERAREIRSIREEQGVLRRQLTRLEERIRALAEAETAALETPPASEPALKSPAPAVPIPAPASEVPPPLPDVMAETATPASAPEGKEKASLEVEIGTVWLVRVAVLVLLSALAFLGAYLYEHVVPHLGPAAKVILLYLAAGGLTGLGAFLERKRDDEAAANDDPSAARHGLQQYARVVLAGGLAAVYYVTYAAHWNPQLRVIPNPFLAGVLLLAWTAFMVFLADRRGSETLATFAILLAYYTSAINEIVTFTLVANLALAAGALFLLRRHLWKVFPFASLLATFGSYGFWRYFHVYSAWRGRQDFPSAAIGTGGFWLEGAFLMIYWLLFTWVVFAPGKKALAATAESTFAGLNNGLFFTLTTWVLLADYPGSFWKWALTFGATLLVLGELGRKLPIPLHPRTEAAYQSGGILLVTWGIIAYFSGWSRDLALAVESTALTLAAGRRRSWLLQSAAGSIALLPVVSFGQFGVSGFSPHATIISTCVGALFVFNAWWCQQNRSEHETTGYDRFVSVVNVTRRIFSVCASVIWYFGITSQISGSSSTSVALVLTAVGITALSHLLRLGALAMCAQFYLLIAVVYWASAHGPFSPGNEALASWNPLILVAGLLGCGHWWLTRTGKSFLAPSRWNVPAIADAVLLVYVLAHWLQPSDPASTDLWVAESAALALLLFGYGLATRYGALAVAGQYFQVASIAAFASLCWQGGWTGERSEPLLTLAPIVGAIGVLVALEQWSVVSASLATPRARRLVGVTYEAMVVFLAVFWGNRYFPHLPKFSLFCLLGGTIFVSGIWRANRRWLVWSAVPTTYALGVFATAYSTTETAAWVHLIGIAAFAAQQQLGRRRLAPETFPFKAQAALMIAATLTGWVWSGAFILRLSHEGTFTVAVSWSLFALVVFAAGFLWRESTYRWLGLIILACTLGHIVLYDIWQLDSLGRIFSAFALGIVLLGIAFAYIKFQRQLKKWF